LLAWSNAGTVLTSGFYGRIQQLPEVVSVSGYLLNGVIGEEELV